MAITIIEEATSTPTVFELVEGHSKITATLKVEMILPPGKPFQAALAEQTEGFMAYVSRIVANNMGQVIDFAKAQSTTGETPEDRPGPRTMRIDLLGTTVIEAVPDAEGVAILAQALKDNDAAMAQARAEAEARQAALEAAELQHAGQRLQ